MQVGCRTKWQSKSLNRKYDKFKQQRLQSDASNADKHVEQLTKIADQLTTPDKVKKDKNKTWQSKT